MLIHDPPEFVITPGFEHCPQAIRSHGLLECSAVLNRSLRRSRVKRDRLAFKSPSGIRADLHRVDEAHGSEETHREIQSRPIRL